jgi:hypothetical protein
MFEKIKKFFSKEESVTEQIKVKKPSKPRKVKESKQELSKKEIATNKGEPYVNIVKMSVDPNDIHNGEFELDFNDKFVLNLIKAGYKMKEDDTDVVIVDRWFQTVCRNVALEMYEQTQADPSNRDVRNVVSRNLGNGRTEVS